MDGRTDSRSDYSADPRFDYFFKLWTDHWFSGGERGCFPQQLKSRLSFKQSGSVYFSNHKKVCLKLLLCHIRMFYVSFIM